MCAGERCSCTAVDGATCEPGVLDIAPVGLLVVAADGIVRSVNDRLVELLGVGRTDVVGRSLLDLVHHHHLDAVLDALVDCGRSRSSAIGPVGIRFTVAGRSVDTVTMWRDGTGVRGVDGLVVAVHQTTIADHLAAAARSIADGAPVDRSVTWALAALSAPPLRSRATLLVVRDGMLAPVGPWPLGSSNVLDERLAADLAGAPWQEVRRLQTPLDVPDVERLAPPLAILCRAAGVQAVWCRPVPTRDQETCGVLVVWRDRGGPPTPTEERLLEGPLSTISIALDQHAYRSFSKRAVSTDRLTGLGNRNRLEQLYGAPDDDVTGVLYIDLDDFAELNRLHGHEVGDEVLMEVGDRLRNALRSRDEVLRVGGDEFVVICRAPGSPGGTEVVADRVVGVLSGEYHLPSAVQPVTVNASIGVDSSKPGLRLRQRVDLAGEAVYSAKTFGSTWRRKSNPR